MRFCDSDCRPPSDAGDLIKSLAAFVRNMVVRTQRVPEVGTREDESARRCTSREWIRSLDVLVVGEPDRVC